MAVSATGWVPAQTHKVEKTESVVRAVGVYEWTGELEKPKASRLIPVTVFINGELEDGAIFQPRPIPFALLPGNEYALQQAGVEKGLLQLTSASKTAGADEGNTDGWWGYGTFQPEREVKAAKLRVLKDERTVSVPKDEEAKTQSKGDPDRPTLRRRSTTGASGKDAGTTKSGDAKSGPDTSVPADDPDRPVLKKRGSATATADGASPTPASKGAGADGDDREVASEALNRDPDRPVLHRGRPANGGVADTADAQVGAKLMAGATAGPAGRKDLHQMVAVSDAKNRAEHDFARAWADDGERKAVLAQMEAMARQRLQAYVRPASTPAGGPQAGALTGQKAGEGTPVQPNGGPTFSPKQGSGSAGTAAGGSAAPSSGAAKRTRGAAATAAARRRAAAKKAAAVPAVDLLDEDLRGYELSYGGAPTFVLTAHTAGTGADLRYVTVVAQRDVNGTLQTAFGSVTDEAHLDRVAAMRLVGVVDAEASNRASLLFELREPGGRQFALYRVLGGRSEALFTTGLTP